MTRPTTAEAMPAIRKGPSGISSAVAMARLTPAGNAARKIPSIAKNKPSAARKSDIDAPSVATPRYFAGPFGRAAAVAAEPDEAAGATGVPSGSVLPDGSP